MCFYTWHAEEALIQRSSTVEKHRFEHPLIAAQDLQLTGISDIIISDTLLSHIYAEQLSNMWLYRHFILHLDQLDSSFTSQVLKIHTSRLDSPEHVIRSQYSRTDNQQTVPMIGSAHRDQGDITIDNHLNGRYEGEIQVIKAPMPGHSTSIVLVMFVIKMFHCYH